MKTLTFRGHNVRVWTFDDASEWFLLHDISSMTKISPSSVRTILIHQLAQHSITRTTDELGFVGRERMGRPRTLINLHALDIVMRTVPWPYAGLFREWLRQGCPPNFDSELRSTPHPVAVALDSLTATEISPRARSVILAAIGLEP